MEEHHESLLVLGLKFDEICDVLSHLNILYTSDSTIPEGTDISLRIQNHLAKHCTQKSSGFSRSKLDHGRSRKSPCLRGFLWLSSSI